jgi:hypothetical protein
MAIWLIFFIFGMFIFSRFGTYVAARKIWQPWLQGLLAAAASSVCRKYLELERHETENSAAWIDPRHENATVANLGVQAGLPDFTP